MQKIRGFGSVVAPALFGAVLLAVPARAAVSDAWITAKTKIALATTEGVPSNSINVDTVDGRVTLHGTVRTDAEKAKAEAEAKKISGVREVRNLLQVVPKAEEKSVDVSDDKIKQHVADALKNDESLRHSSISVQSVNDGVVLLAGKADTVSDHLHAVEAARAVPGVRRVASEVESPDKLADAEIRRQRDRAESGARRGVGDAASDMWITSAAKLRLLTDSRTPATDINVDTRDGAVTLFGIVPSQAAKTAAEEDVKKVSGVRRVVNSIEVVPSSRREQVDARDDDVQKAIEQKIKDRESLHDASISVDVKNGVARLTGSVPSEEERLEAAIAARSTAGVRSVQDQLRVTEASAH